MTPKKTESLEMKANNGNGTSLGYESLKSRSSDQTQSERVRRVVEEAFENERFLFLSEDGVLRIFYSRSAKRGAPALVLIPCL